MKISRLTGGVLAAAPLLGTVAAAQNTGGVPGPAVNPGERTAELRLAWVPEGDDQLATRFQFDVAATDDLRWRLVGQTLSTEGDGTDFDFAELQVFYELGEVRPGWQTGLRFDGRVRSDGRPGQIRVNWTNQFAVSERWTARVAAFNSLQVGNGGSGDLSLQLRSSLGYRTEGGSTIGIESYDTFGPYDDLGRWSDRGHQTGPYVNAPLGGGWSAFGSVLIGTSDATPDATLRLFVGRSL
ncbi:hypothetical protein [Parvularcula dongshanensis]|uniref:Uncharacterized protein n=1 Tax=Parvularcula dongshanensis TaxID=1173995 RepID=A0A840I3V6_9PROT|nr:hypothetical protein [Parvularcula dongshanensis]MBB4658992.1 hypothetical protein [Parvularcula dongshanensis]